MQVSSNLSLRLWLRPAQHRVKNESRLRRLRTVRRQQPLQRLTGYAMAIPAFSRAHPHPRTRTPQTIALNASAPDYLHLSSCARRRSASESVSGPSEMYANAFGSGLERVWGASVAT